MKNTRIKTTIAALAVITFGVSGCITPPTQAQQNAINTTVAALANDALMAASGNTQQAKAQAAADAVSGVASLAQAYLGLTIPSNILAAATTGNASNVGTAIRADLTAVPITADDVAKLWQTAEQLYTKTKGSA